MLGAALGRGQAVQEAAVATGRPLYPFGARLGDISPYWPAIPASIFLFKSGDGSLSFRFPLFTVSRSTE